MLQVEHAVATRRHPPFVLGSGLAVGGAASHAVAATGEASAVLAVRWLVVVLLAVAFLGAVTQRVPAAVGERLAWFAVLPFVVLEVLPHARPDVGGALDGTLRILLVNVVMVLLTYLVWSPRAARALSGIITVAANVGLAVTLSSYPDPAEVLMAVPLPVIVVLMCEAYTARARVLAGSAMRAQAEAELGRTDHLTGLRNRRGLLVDLQRVTTGDAVLLVDVDHFKRVNDQHGHDVGDAVLRRIASVLAGAVRDGDALGRWGGEEFVVVGPRRSDGSASVDATALGERLCRAVRHDDEAPCVTVSVGVAVARSEDVDWQDALRRADACLYAAKAAGRDRVVSSPDDPMTSVVL